MALTRQECGRLGGRRRTVCTHGDDAPRYKAGGCKLCGDDRAAQHKAERKRWVDGLKLERGCTNCGYQKSARALSFHHLDPTTKRFAISQGLGRSRENILAEIAKCVVLCANCHFELHESGEED